METTRIIMLIRIDSIEDAVDVCNRKFKQLFKSNIERLPVNFPYCINTKNDTIYPENEYDYTVKDLNNMFSFSSASSKMLFARYLVEIVPNYIPGGIAYYLGEPTKPSTYLEFISNFKFKLDKDNKKIHYKLCI